MTAAYSNNPHEPKRLGLSIQGRPKGWKNLRQRLQQEKKSKKSSSMPCYAKRKEELSFLGYRSYVAYLRSDVWKTIRAIKLAGDPDCLLCNKRAIQVHHLSYAVEVLAGAALHHLIPLCRACHETIEFDGKDKRSLEEANQVLIKVATKSERGRKWLAWMKREEQASCQAKKKRRRTR